MEFHVENSSAVIDQTTVSTGVLRMESLAGFAPGGWPAREAVRFSPSGGLPSSSKAAEDTPRVTASTNGRHTPGAIWASVP